MNQTRESGQVDKVDLLNKMKRSVTQMNRAFKESGAGFITRKIFLAVSTLNLTKIQTPVLTPEFLKKIRLLIRKQVMIEISLIGLILFPFAS